MMIRRSILFCFLPLVLGAGLLSASSSDREPSHSIQQIDDMGAVRSAHTMTVLDDGRVLIVGGMTNREGRLVPAELFDPAANRFLPTQLMNTPRHSHTATKLGDGRVLITGGYNLDGDYLNSTEIFDPHSGRFSPWNPMTTTRAGHKAITLKDGRILIVGGVGTGWTFLSSAEVYDPETGQFETTGSMRETRESHSVVGLSDGTVLVIGGHTGRRSAMRLFDLIERYDPKKGTFSPAGTLVVARHKQDATLLQDGTVLVSGGADTRDADGVYDSVEIYDPSTETSSMSNPMQLGRYKHEGNSILLDDNRILFAGGATRAERYEPNSGHSEIVEGASNLAGQFSASVLLSDGRVLITGGYGANAGSRASAWIYNPSP